MSKTLSIIVLVILTLIWAGPADAEKSQFNFSSWGGPEIRVFITHPSGLAPDRPVVFVMHGMSRNADDYRDQWHDLAIKHDFLLVVPEFSQARFPGSRVYNLGNVFDADGRVVKEANWSYSAIELIFDEIRSRFAVTTERYSLYGHSAGAQFVHRYIFHVPEARVSQIVPANAGWYMMPDYERDYPYGLQGSVITPEELKKALQLPVTILLGDQDTDPRHESLRRRPEAMAQGEHRFARGHTFFEAARDSAAQFNVPFNWQLATVPGAGHDNQLMAPAAFHICLAQHATNPQLDTSFLSEIRHAAEIARPVPRLQLKPAFPNGPLLTQRCLSNHRVLSH